jgi:hypothetical protein
MCQPSTAHAAKARENPEMKKLPRSGKSCAIPAVTAARTSPGFVAVH